MNDKTVSSFNTFLRVLHYYSPPSILQRSSRILCRITTIDVAANVPEKYDLYAVANL